MTLLMGPEKELPLGVVLDVEVEYTWDEAFDELEGVNYVTGLRVTGVEWTQYVGEVESHWTGDPRTFLERTGMALEEFQTWVESRLEGLYCSL